MTRKNVPIRLFIFALLLMPIAGLAFLGFTHAMNYRELKSIRPVESFTLTDSLGRKLSLSDFRNRVWIASFIFTHCAEQCPAITRQMQALAKRFKGKPEIRLISFGIDPEHDTIPDLGAYARSFGADPGKWVFLTGDKATMTRLVESSFKLNMKDGDGGDIIHSSHLVLVDGYGMIRGYYDAMSEESMTLLIADAKNLARGIY